MHLIIITTVNYYTAVHAVINHCFHTPMSNFNTVFLNCWYLLWKIFFNHYSFTTCELRKHISVHVYQNFCSFL